MSTVTLDALWIHDAADLDVYVVIPLAGLTDVSSRSVNVERFADGSFGEIDTLGTTKRFEAALELVDFATVADLDAFAGRRVLVRDPRSRRFWAVHPGVIVTEIPGLADHRVDATVTFTEITFDEAV